MKTFTRLAVMFAALLVVVGFFPPDGRAGEAEAALALAAATRMRAKATPCGIPGCDCDCASGAPCVCGVKAGSLSYAQGYALAVARGKPLLVWVGYAAVPAYTGHWASAVGWVQCVKDRMDGCSGACLCVARPDGQGGMENLSCLSTAGRPVQESEVTLVLNRPRVDYSRLVRSIDDVLATQPAVYAAPVFRPQFFSPPPMTFRGGFGGGCSGGG